MVKRRKKPAERLAKVKVKEVTIAPTEIIRIVAPPGVTPAVVAIDVTKRVVEVVPVTKTKRLSWWQSLFR
jgi:hypothetical protein